MFKVRNTTWYSNFFMTQYENQRWVEHFHVTRKVILQITKKLQPLIQKQDTNYRCTIPTCMLLFACCYNNCLFVIEFVCLLVVTTIVCLLLHFNACYCSACYYRCIVLVSIKVACSLYKLTHGVNYHQCNEMFVIGKSSVNMVLHEFVIAINVV